MQTRVLSLLLLIVLTASIGSGCATARTVLHPIQDTDIAEMKEGVAYTSKTDGFFISKLYMSEVMQAKVEKVN